MSTEPILICYRGACENPAHPLRYNRITHGLYCLECARTINDVSIADEAHGGAFYPYLAFVDVNAGGGSLAPGLIVHRVLDNVPPRRFLESRDPDEPQT